MSGHSNVNHQSSNIRPTIPRQLKMVCSNNLIIIYNIHINIIIISFFINFQNSIQTRKRQHDGIIITKFNITIRRANIETLNGENWLDDEIINFYMNLLMERSKICSQSEGLPRVYAFNTFFMTRLLTSGYAGVRRWTKNVDIFEYELIPVPVHVNGVHWCMAIIDFRHRTIRYYDSLGSKNPEVLNKLADYLVEEALDKKGQTFDMGGWSLKSMTNIPQQKNQSDCGVFSCAYADVITRNEQIQFTHKSMRWLRLKMSMEIRRGRVDFVSVLDSVSQKKYREQ